MATETVTTATHLDSEYVETTINYFPEEGGTTTYQTGGAEFFKRKFIPKTIRVQNIRGQEGDFTLEKQGFRLINHQSGQGDFKDEKRIKDFYFAETEKVIQEV